MFDVFSLPLTTIRDWCILLAVVVALHWALSRPAQLVPIEWPETTTTTTIVAAKTTPVIVRPRCTTHRCQDCGRFARCIDNGVTEGSPWWITACSKCGEVEHSFEKILRREQ